MNWWMCDECEYIFEADVKPGVCPQCHKIGNLSEVTCYVSECGGRDNPDLKLVALKAKQAKSK